MSLWTWVAIALAVLIVLTVWMTLHMRGRTLSAASVVPLWGAGACLALLAGAFFYYSAAIRVYDKCVGDANRSIGSRIQTLYFYDVIDVLAKSPHITSDPIFPGRPSLRQSLDINLPALNPSHCVKP